MLAAKRLPLILRSALTADLEAVCLLTSEGSILSSAFLSPKGKPSSVSDEVTLAAVSTSIWAHYVQGKLQSFSSIIISSLASVLSSSSILSLFSRQQ